MSEQEITSRLKEHLKHCINHHGRINNDDRGYCIRYIMDFKQCNKAEAEELYKEVLYKDTIKSEIFEGTEFYRYMNGELVIKTQNCGMLNISMENIPKLIKELERLGEYHDS